jgi:hypothetical protein
MNERVQFAAERIGESNTYACDVNDEKDMNDLPAESTVMAMSFEVNWRCKKVQEQGVYMQSGCGVH